MKIVKKIVHRFFGLFGYSVVDNSVVDRGIFYENLSGVFTRYLAGKPREDSIEKFLMFCASQKDLTRSQLLQEYLYLFVRQSKIPKGAVFLEVGVGDGVNHSNNLILERSFGMRGVLVEGDPRQRAEIHRNRVATLVPVLAGNASGEAELNLSSTPELSHVSGAVQTEIISQNIRKAVVKVETLNEILGEELADDEFIDFVTIDVEGFELQVLEGFDLTFFKPAVLCVEFNYDQKYRSELISAIGDNYTLVFDSISACDLWFIRSDLISRVYE